MLYLRTVFFMPSIVRMKLLKVFLVCCICFSLYGMYHMYHDMKYVKMDTYDFYTEESNIRYDMADKICMQIYENKKLPKKYTKVQTLDLLTPFECKLLINDANEYASNSEGYFKNRHINYPTTDIPVGYLDSYSIILSKMHIIFNTINKEYNVDPSLLNVTDIFFVRYDHNKQNKLNEHKDGSEFSFIITLNDDFEGGGTKINDNVYKLKIGQCLVFCGQNYHSGVDITKGVRYIVAGFIRIINEEFSDSYNSH